tara:strand:+ start:43 stop:432 length:390 start_codon:yes stop_codon:yes gene_type:complete
VSKKGKEPEWVEMPSISKNNDIGIDPGENYHDLGKKYPHAPVPRRMDDIIVHRAILEDISGVSRLMDWVSDGDIVIVEMTDIMEKETELHLTVNKIQEFIERDMNGQVVRLGQKRLLLLPPNFDSSRIN